MTWLSENGISIRIPPRGAFVVARPGRPPSPDELREFCAEALADYKIPKVFRWPGALPRTASGKIVKTAPR